MNWTTNDNHGTDLRERGPWNYSGLSVDQRLEWICVLYDELRLLFTMELYQSLEAQAVRRHVSSLSGNS